MEELVKLVEEIATQQDTNTELIVEMNDEINSLKERNEELENDYLRTQKLTTDLATNTINVTTELNTKFIDLNTKLFLIEDHCKNLSERITQLATKLKDNKSKCWFQVGDRVSFISNDGFYIYEIKTAVIREVIDCETVFIEETTDWYLFDLFKNKRKLTVKTKDIKLR